MEVASEHILIAKSVFRVIANSQVCHIYQNIKKTLKLSVFSPTLKILEMREREKLANYENYGFVWVAIIWGRFKKNNYTH